MQGADLEGKGRSFFKSHPICIVRTENEVTLGGSPCPQTSHREADAFKGVVAQDQAELSFFVDSLPKFNAALNAVFPL